MRSRFVLRRNHIPDVTRKIGVESSVFVPPIPGIHHEEIPMKIGKYKPSQIRKAITAGAGLVVELGNQTLEQFTVMPQPIHTVLTVVIGIATVAATFLVKNEKLIDATDNL
jgi:hypothetical protein